MVPSDLIVRNYKQEDLPCLIELYDEASDRSPHFPRDKNFLEYFMHYPGVDYDSIFVAVESKKIVGLAIISVTVEEENLRQGRIVELQAKDALSIGALIQAAEQYCHSKDVDVIVAAPPPFAEIDKVFHDWQRFETGAMMGRLLTVMPFLQALLDTDKVKKSYAGKSIIFHIDSETIKVEITPGSVEATEDNAHLDQAAITVAMPANVLLELALGTANPYVAYLTRRLRVRGIRNAAIILKLLRMVRLPKPWPIGLIDRM